MDGVVDGVAPTGNLIGRLWARRPEESGVLAALIVLVAIVSVVRPTFLIPVILFQQVANAAIIGMLALGMVFVVVVRDIDLSVGWNFNFSAVIAATAMTMGLNPWLGLLIGVAFGALLGLVNGLLAVRLRLPVIVITLGTMSMFQGLSLVTNGSKAIVPPDTTGSFFTLVQARLFGVVPSIAIVFLVVAVVLHIVMHHTRFGYQVQALGSNPVAARLGGIPVARTRVLTLVVIGTLAGLTGSLFLGLRGAIDPVTGGEFMLPVVAAVIIGGTPLSGGKGTLIGAVIGALIIQVITAGILFLGVPDTWSTFVTGAVIILAVSVDQIIKRRSGGRLRDSVDSE